MRFDRSKKHPEGGHYQEVFKSSKKVQGEKGHRFSLTHIYFSLTEGEVSRFHKVSSDEVWNLYKGEICLYLWDDALQQMKCVRLSNETREYCHVVPAGIWQAAKPLKKEVLVGCSVAPGFEFEDFELIDAKGQIAKNITDKHPDLELML